MRSPACQKSQIYEIVGGDAHIAPAAKPAENRNLRRIRNMFERADVGIGPYGQVFSKV